VCLTRGRLGIVSLVCAALGGCHALPRSHAPKSASLACVGSKAPRSLRSVVCGLSPGAPAGAICADSTLDVRRVRTLLRDAVTVRLSDGSIVVASVAAPPSDNDAAHDDPCALPVVSVTRDWRRLTRASALTAMRMALDAMSALAPGDSVVCRVQTQSNPPRRTVYFAALDGPEVARTLAASVDDDDPASLGGFVQYSEYLSRAIPLSTDTTPLPPTIPCRRLRLASE
jgi:hypothetical protein